MASGTPIPPLTDQQKIQWNRFIDFMDKEGYKGSDQLDNRDTNMGKFLFQKFKSKNPDVTITYDDVPRVQADLQNYRQHLINQYKSGKMVDKNNDIKDPDKEIMPGLSQVDGWLGSKTSSYKFPTAAATNLDQTVTNYGVNTGAYDTARGKQ